MSTHEGEVVGEPKGSKVESEVRFAPDLVDGRMKAYLEPLKAQISALTEMMDRLIQSNSARRTTRTSTYEARHLYESLHHEASGTARFPTVALFSAMGHSHDTEQFRDLK